jgi:hypothetical protein
MKLYPQAIEIYDKLIALEKPQVYQHFNKGMLCDKGSLVHATGVASNSRQKEIDIDNTSTYRSVLQVYEPIR